MEYDVRLLCSLIVFTVELLIFHDICVSTSTTRVKTKYIKDVHYYVTDSKLAIFEHKNQMKMKDEKMLRKTRYMIQLR